MLDTTVFLWWIKDDEQLDESLIQLIADARNRLAISAATVWELAKFVTDGVVAGISNIHHLAENEGFEVLPLEGHHLQLAGDMKSSNPALSFIVAQVQAEGATLITANRRFKEYGIRTYNAQL